MIKYLSPIGIGCKTMFKGIISIPVIFISTIVVIYCIVLICFVSLPIVIFALLTLLLSKIKYFFKQYWLKDNVQEAPLP